MRIYATLLFLATAAHGQSEDSLNWVFQAGDLQPQSTSEVRVDAAGNAYAGGFFKGTVDFDPGAGVLEFTAVGQQGDPYLAKYNADGNLLWARHLVGNGEVLSMSIDEQNNVLATGFYNQDLVLDMSTTLTTSLSGTFLAKYNGSGSLLWAFGLETGSGTNIGHNLDTAADGSILLAGVVRTTVDLDPGPGMATISAGPRRRDPFLAKYDADGNFLWGQVIRQNNTGGSSLSDLINAVMFDSANNVYAAGIYIGSTNFGFPGSTETLVSAPTDAFLLKLDSDGNLLWVRSTAGTGIRKEHFGLDSDSLGNLYMAGMFLGDTDFDPDPVGEALATSISLDGFILSYDAAGDFRWFGQISAATIGMPRDLLVAADGTLLVVGEFRGPTDFDPGPGVFGLNSLSARDPFIAKYAGNGDLITAYHLVTSPVSSYRSTIHSVSSNGEGFWVAGEFQGPVDFDPGPDESILSSVIGSRDLFMARYGGGVFRDGFEGAP